jgi:hypothetical protein
MTDMMTYVLVGMTLAIGQVESGTMPAAPAPMNVPGAAPPSAVVPAPDGSPATNSWAPPQNGANGSDSSNNNNGEEAGGFFRRFFKIYADEFRGTAGPEEEGPVPVRRTNPSPFPSPPLPTNEYQGYPLIGVPPDDTTWPIMKAIYGANTPFTDRIKDSKIKFYGWVTSSGNWSTANNTNAPTSYWVVPNRYELDQVVFRLERNLDSVQQDHIDVGGRITIDYGMDYRYFTAGGWFSEQLLKHNLLYGWDPTEVYMDVYFPGITQGMIVRVGRWIACPDIETQFSVDNYLGSHSILFTFDTYTQTGVMLSFLLRPRWEFQVGINAGNDMAPWYKGATPSGFVGLRWVSESNNDATYTCLNQINNAEFRHFNQYDQPLGHDNFNYIVSTWEHRFDDAGKITTKTEGYFMWQRNAELGGTPSAGPLKPFGGGGGDGVLIPGTSLTYGLLNYSEFVLNKKDYITIRNEWWRDEKGMRSGFPGTYTSHTIGLSHQFNSLFMVRPEIGYYRNWTNPAFDLGNTKGVWIYGFDVTLRF